MPPIAVDAELKRRDAALALVNWLLVADTDNIVTGLSDPVIDYAVRAALGDITDPDTATTVIGRLQQIISRLPATLDTGALRVAIQNWISSISVTQGTSPWVVDDPDIEPVRNRFNVVTSLVNSIASVATTTLYTPAAGNATRIIRVWIHGSQAIGAAPALTEFELRVGATILDHDEVVQDAPYAHSNVREGAADEVLVLETLHAGKIYYNIDVIEFTP